ncbi:MAG TPA: hypothetical protein VFV32_07190 [Acidimicrobiales bacterium]|nr:hypothetical protein [Acidimicrobiales bacterium]
MDSCIKHPHESGVAICGRCGGSWCSTCIVYPFGEKKPPLCMACAMVAAGVRTAGARPALGRREIKALQKQAKAEAKAAATRGAPQPPAEAEPEVAPAEAPVDSLDWDRNWWESSDREPTLTD